MLGVESDGRVTLSAPTGNVPADLTPVLGAHTLSELTADADDEYGERRVARPPSMRTDEDVARIDAERAGAD